MTDPQASIVICTHNPNALLQEVLQALSVQEGIEHTEILIIDNASREPVTLPQDLQLVARIVREQKLGLSHARNRAIMEAKTDLLLFLDDDAIPQAGWLSAFLQAATDYPEAASFGGFVEAAFTQPLPPWIGPGHLPYFGAFDKGPNATTLAYPDFPRGCNMMLRKNTLGDRIRFAHVFGKRGTRQACYEEIDLCWRLEKEGHVSIYVPGACVKHIMRTQRLSKEWFDQRVFEQGKAVRLFERRHAISPSTRMLKHPWYSALHSHNLERRLALGYLWGSLISTE